MNKNLVDYDSFQTFGQVESFIFSDLRNVVSFMINSINSAKNEILFVTSYWEKDSKTAKLVCECIEEKVKFENIKVKIIVDNGNVKNIVKNSRIIKNEKLGFKTKNDSKLFCKSYHKPLLGTMHCKFVIIDRETVILMSNNVQDRPNLEMGVVFTGAITRLFFKVFCNMWNKEKTEKLENITRNNLVKRTQDILFLFACRNPCGSFCRDFPSSQNRVFMKLFQIAEKEILVQTPTLNAKHCLEWIFESCKRNVVVTIYLTLGFNDKKESLPFQGGTNKYNVEKLYKRLDKIDKKQNFIVYWYVAKNQTIPSRKFNSHVKFMAVDKKYAMFGNANMDTQSIYHSMEANVMIESKDIVTSMIEKLLASQNRVGCRAKPELFYR